MSDSFSSSLSSLSDELSFIFEEFSHDTGMKHVLDDETYMKKIQLLMKLRQATQPNGASSS